MSENILLKKTDRSLALLSYVWALVLAPLLFWGKDDFIHFHARQGVILFLFESILMIFSVAIPVVGPMMIFPLALVVSIVFSILGIINVLGEHKEKLPLIGHLADKIKLN